jgi:hypothetical protein
MAFNIYADVFWEKTKTLYHNDTRHIKDMLDMPSILGLSYKDTDYDPDSELVVLRFEITDREKFFLAKIAYGL